MLTWIETIDNWGKGNFMKFGLIETIVNILSLIHI